MSLRGQETHESVQGLAEEGRQESRLDLDPQPGEELRAGAPRRDPVSHEGKEASLGKGGK